MTSDFNKFKSGDNIDAYGLTGWNKFHIYAVINLTNNNEISLAKSGWLQVISGFTLSFIVLLFSRLPDLGYQDSEKNNFIILH